jgi:hypothetical protein
VSNCEGKVLEREDVKKESTGSGGVEERSPEGDLIKAEFSRRWFRQLGISGQVVLFVFPVASMAHPPSWLLWVAGVSLVVGLGGSFWNWRCPHCSSYFGKQFFRMRHCSICGVELA